jgi:hypothetical protein
MIPTASTTTATLRPPTIRPHLKLTEWTLSRSPEIPSLVNRPQERVWRNLSVASAFVRPMRRIVPILAAVLIALSAWGGSSAALAAKWPVRPLHVETGGFELGTGKLRGKASLEATLYPKGNYAQFWFQWGRSAAYGHVTNVYLDEGLGAFGPEEVYAIIEHLRPATTYHYRVVASNRLGKVYGADRVFRTRRG